MAAPLHHWRLHIGITRIALPKRPGRREITCTTLLPFWEVLYIDQSLQTAADGFFTPSKTMPRLSPAKKPLRSRE